MQNNEQPLDYYRQTYRYGTKVRTWVDFPMPKEHYVHLHNRLKTQAVLTPFGFGI